MRPSKKSSKVSDNNQVITKQTPSKLSKTAPLSQVRIIGGQYRRRLVSFVEADGLRPTPDRVRETLFNWLDFELPNARVLDCCAGSGVLGFEALSRGASHVTLIEPNFAQFRQLQATQQALNIPTSQLTLINQPAQSALSGFTDSQAFDVVFLDPPYQLMLWDDLLTLLQANNLISADSLLYIEADRPLVEAMPLSAAKFEFIKEKKMGQVYSGLARLSATHLS